MKAFVGNVAEQTPVARMSMWAFIETGKLGQRLRMT